jgi:hypothetical protein
VEPEAAVGKFGGGDCAAEGGEPVAQAADAPAAGEVAPGADRDRHRGGLVDDLYLDEVVAAGGTNDATASRTRRSTPT